MRTQTTYHHEHDSFFFFFLFGRESGGNVPVIYIPNGKFTKPFDRRRGHTAKFWAQRNMYTQSAQMGETESASINKKLLLLNGLSLLVVVHTRATQSLTTDANHTHTHQPLHACRSQQTQKINHTIPFFYFHFSSFRLWFLVFPLAFLFVLFLSFVWNGDICRWFFLLLFLAATLAIPFALSHTRSPIQFPPHSAFIKYTQRHIQIQNCVHIGSYSFSFREKLLLLLLFCLSTRRTYVSASRVHLRMNRSATTSGAHLSHFRASTIYGQKRWSMPYGKLVRDKKKKSKIKSGACGSESERVVWRWERGRRTSSVNDVSCNECIPYVNAIYNEHREQQYLDRWKWW